MTTLAEDAVALSRLKRQVSITKHAADEAKLEADQAEAALFERMETEGVGGIRLEGIGNFVKAQTQYGQVQDSSEFIRWAEAEMPELLETRPRKALVNEIVRERLDSGEQLPPGLGFYAKTYVSVRAA